ncbi:hypothetical protein QBC37DRAFT_266403, partial [Rhypophila decipiens]
PVVLCTILSVLIQVLCANLRAVMPFAILSGHQYSKSGGVSASDSVCLVLGGIKGPLTSLGLLWRLREPLPFLLDLLIFLSTILTSISTSTVSLGFFGFCEAGSHDGWCYMGLGYYSLTLKIAEGMLICMAVLLLPVGLLLMKLKTGVASPPWSVGYIASLSVSVSEPNIRGLWDVLREMKAPKDDGNIPSKMVKHLERYNFTLGQYRRRDGITEYGILAHEKHESNPHMPTLDETKETTLPRRNPKRADLHTIFQTTVLILLSALFILITYYESVEIDPLQPSSSSISISISFEQFMDSQSIAVSILFTSLAVCITLFWDYLFSQSIVTTFWWRFDSTVYLTSRADMMQFSPPITVFDGFVKSTFLALVVSTLVALAGILSKGIPILMAHIPFRRYQTWGLHLATGWTTVGILGYMILVLGAYLVVVIVDRKKKRKQLPVRPDCIAGLVYYLTCDGGEEVVRDFQKQQRL